MYPFPCEGQGYTKNKPPKMITVFGGFVVYLSGRLKMPGMGNPITPVIHAKVRKPEYKPCT